MNNIWLALVEIKAIGYHETLKEGKGAFINVAYKASGYEEFMEQLKSTFSNKNLLIVGIDDLETKENLSIASEGNTERLELIRDIEDGHDFSWGIFHSYDLSSDEN